MPPVSYLQASFTSGVEERPTDAGRRSVYEGRTAGLLEQDRADTFQQQLGNIPGETAVEVEIRVLHPLPFRAGAPSAEWEYRSREEAEEVRIELKAPAPLDR